MIARYPLLAQRLRNELQMLEQVVERAEGGLRRANEQVEDREYFLTAGAFDLHSFYTGLERVLELIAREVDQSLPSSPHWHRDLLSQMSLTIPNVRPAVLAPETETALDEYLRFRHVVRNVYTFNLHPVRVAELIGALRPTFEQVQRDLLTFAGVLETLATADEEEDTEQG